MLFENVDGLYPYENLKAIQDKISELEPSGGAPTKAQMAASRSKIVTLWKGLREAILSEYDRDVPASPNLSTGRLIR